MRFHTDAWRDAYAARIDQLLKPMVDAGLKVIWCGNPIARSGTYSADMNYINDIYAAEAARFGAQFVPLWTAIADDQGRYAAYGKDRGGVTQRMRADDGIHFTGPGYELIAEKIIEQQEAKFDPTEFKDRYEDALRDLIARKKKGEKLVSAEKPADEDKVVDLMEALKKSLGREGARGEERPAAAREAAGKRRPAAAAPRRETRGPRRRVHKK